MAIKNLLQIPLFLWFIIVRYYGKRLLGKTIAPVESNWIYFLKLAIPQRVKIRKYKNNFLIYNPVFKHEVEIRDGNSSDILVYIQIFFHREYKLIESLLLPDNATVLDLGGNVSFFSLYLKSFLPHTSVICVEPDENNCRQILVNKQLNAFDKLAVIHAAVWLRNEPVTLLQPGDGLEWSFAIQNNKDGEIEGITLRSIIEQSGLTRVDLLKMDIEGTEEILFKDNDFLTTLKNYVHAVIMETHDPTEKKRMIRQLELNGFTTTESGDLILAKQSITK